MTVDVQAKVHTEFTKYPRRTYAKGQILLFADENPPHIFYLVSGRVRKYDVSYRGDEVIVNIFKPPAFFPMSWALAKTPNKYFYKTEEETALHVVPTEKVVEFLQQNADVTIDLMSRVYQGLEGLLGRLVHLMSGSAQSRLMYELVIECQRFGLPDKEGTFQLVVSEVDLAARSGLSRETVSREINKLKNYECVKTQNGHIYVTDIEAMKGRLARGI